MTDIVATNSSGTNRNVFTTELRNPSTGAGFYIIRHAESTSKAVESFQLTVAHSKGETTFGNITLAGRDARMAYADHAFGHTHVLFTTGMIAFSTTIDGVDVLLLHGQKGMRDLYFSLLGVDSLQTAGSLRVEGPASVDLLASSESDKVRCPLPPSFGLDLAERRFLLSIFPSCSGWARLPGQPSRRPI